MMLHKYLLQRSILTLHLNKQLSCRQTCHRWIVGMMPLVRAIFLQTLAALFFGMIKDPMRVT